MTTTTNEATSVVYAAPPAMVEQSKLHHVVSIYHLYTISHRRVILAAAAMLALLTPFTDTVYLPALALVGEDFDASASMVALTVSIYLACVGLGQLLWGPLSDKYGRHFILIWALLVYLGLTIGCIFSATIVEFLILRSLQGFIVGATIIIAQAVIADVFPGYERGEAMGAFLAPMLFGPVIAPLLGGIVSQLFGWRACFIMLAVMTGPILILTYLFVPETHHYYVKQRVHRKDHVEVQEENCRAGSEYQPVAVEDITTTVPPTTLEHDNNTHNTNTSTHKNIEESSKSAAITEADIEEAIGNGNKGVSINEFIFERYDPNEATRIKELIVSKNHDYDALQMTLMEAKTIPEPTLDHPLGALLLMFDPLMAPFMLTCATSFALMFSALTIAPMLLVQEPYNLSESIVGVTFLSFGIGALLGAMFGGKLSDDSQRTYSQCKQGRMIYILWSTPLIVIGGMAFAYAMQYGVHLSVVLIAQFVIGFVQSAILTNCMVYLGEVKPDKAAAACAVMMCLCFCFAAICVACTVPAAEVITLSGYFWIMSGAYVLAVLGWCYIVYSEMSKYPNVKKDEEQSSKSLEGGDSSEGKPEYTSIEMAESQVATIME